MNTVNLIGNLGNDPEIKYLNNDNGTCACSFNIAVPRWNKKENREEPNWIKCKAYGKTAENIGEYFKKGHKIGITGEIVHNTWKNEQGENRSMTYILVSRIDFLTKKEDKPTEQVKYAEEEYTDDLISEDEIPF